MNTGIKHIKETKVTEQNCAKTMGSGTLEVFATPSMIALMEGCCHESIESFLQSDESTVGMSVEITHVSPSPIGMNIRCESELVEIEGRILKFNVTAYDDKGIIGSGIHKRCIINSTKFMSKAISKLN